MTTAPPFSHKNKSAHPGYYQVYFGPVRHQRRTHLHLTLRVPQIHVQETGKDEKLIADLATSNKSRSEAGTIRQEGDGDVQAARSGPVTQCTFMPSPVTGRGHRGAQKGAPKRFRSSISWTRQSPWNCGSGSRLSASATPKSNLTERNGGGRAFPRCGTRRRRPGQALLSKINVSGGTDRQRGIFYSCLYRSFLWPALRSETRRRLRGLTAGNRQQGVPLLHAPFLVGRLPQQTGLAGNAVAVRQR